MNRIIAEKSTKSGEADGEIIIAENSAAHRDSLI
jgi:hypothetical protein